MTIVCRQECLQLGILQMWRVLNIGNLKNRLHEWQSRVENEHYSVAYFDPITFVKGWAVTCGADVSICK